MKKFTIGFSAAFIALSMNAYSQTNVFDDIIVPSPDHSYLEAAILQEGLQGALQNNAATLTVFAPTNQAFDNLAAALGTDINGLLALPNLTDILTYHVLGVTVQSGGITNGSIAQPLSATNTLKLTLKGNGDVFVNHAQVTGANNLADNGVVHVLDAVVLPYETVVDIAIDNGFTSLTAAVATAELLPALTNPLATYTVFAPTNQAFDNAAMALGTDINGLLALPNLADILTYHVLGAEVLSTGVTNGAIVQPLNASNTLKMTVKDAGKVFANQAEVTSFDITSQNGVVHVLDAIVLPSETVIDVAIDNGFTSLASAIIEAELMPALTNPFTELTVFAPSNQAFTDLAAALGTDLNGVLSNPELADILLYHVVSGSMLSGDLANGSVPTLNGQSVVVDLSSGVMINSSNVTTPNLQVDNGVVHVIDAVLVPSLASLEEGETLNFNVYPNPASDFITIDGLGTVVEEALIMDLNGRVLIQTSDVTNSIDVNSLESGTYIIGLRSDDQVATKKLTIY